MKLRLTSRMRAGFAAMSVLLLAGGLVTVLYTYRMQTATTDLLAYSVMNLKTAEGLEFAVERLRDLTAEEILTDHPERQSAFESHKEEFRRLLRQAASTARAPEQSEVVRRLEERFAVYEDCTNRARHLARGGQETAALTLFDQASGVAESLYASCERLEGLKEHVMYAELGHMERSNQAVRFAMYGLGASGIVLGYALSLMLSRRITDPICELVLKVRGAAGNELVERVDVHRGTEIEELDEHVRHLIERINTTRADLEKSRRLLQRSERLAALGRVSAGVAHEIRNPLTAIKMLIYSMGEETPLGEDQKRDLAVVAREIDRMDRFVDSFLKFARPADPQFVLVDLNQVVHETLDLLALRVRRSNIRVVEGFDVTIGRIAADPDQLRQVIMNLVLNALDAMPDGGDLRIETQRVVLEGAGWIQVRVQDNGAGIPDSLLETLFDPFVSGREDGAGLGLAISYQIVRQHSGWIDAVNNPDGGATVVVSIPDHRGQEDAQGTRGGRSGERPLLVPKNAA